MSFKNTGDVANTITKMFEGLGPDGEGYTDLFKTYQKDSVINIYNFLS